MSLELERSGIIIGVYDGGGDGRNQALDTQSTKPYNLWTKYLHAKWRHEKEQLNTYSFTQQMSRLKPLAQIGTALLRKPSGVVGQMVRGLKWALKY